MERHKIIFKPSVEKDLKYLPPATVSRIQARILQLSSDPYPVKVVKLSGAERMYRLRVGVYRVIYEVDNQAKLITIHYVRHRREVYRGI
ncbi:MAG TPA: type II toxin-antitoxin system RelE/ParE family toxin [bacterium]|nr:type II toxin-antitoxin system RelE/ParE family toxin [bacterium]